MVPLEQPGLRHKASRGWFIAFWAVFLPGIVVSAILALKLVVSDISEPLFPEILLAAIPGLVLVLGAYFINRGLRFDSLVAKAMVVVSAAGVYWYVIDTVVNLLAPGATY